MNENGGWPGSENLAYLEGLLEDFQRDPNSVPEQWRSTLTQLAASESGTGAVRTRPRFEPGTVFQPTVARASGNGRADAVALQDRIDQMVRAYRVRGHMRAQLDPLGLPRGGPQPELDPEYYGFGPEHMQQRFSCRTIAGANKRTLAEIIELLRNTYCRFIGVQFMHIDDLQVRHWLQERMEGSENRLVLSRREQFRILTRLTEAVIFEEFIRKKFKGEKSFSLEGGESLIPLLDLTIEKAAEQGLEEIVIGMAHRGRLNVLANIMGKNPRKIFREFADFDAMRHIGRGDVKYHLGYHTVWKAANDRDMHLSLCFNPSHLEFVNPVAQGRARAWQDRHNDRERRRNMALLIHGDAAFAGEGIVQETLNLSQLPGYRIGGTLHVVVNNQIGFTTDPADGRSCVYATDVAKMLQAPIFHVNGENPEAVAQVVRLAMDFRATFQRDVFIDMYCFRRLGHNETDEPSFTQPIMYRAIAERKSVRDSYLEHLLALRGITREEADEVATRLGEHLDRELQSVHEELPGPESAMAKIWKSYRGGPDAETPETPTHVPESELRNLLEKLATVPPDFQPHPTMKRKLLPDRLKVAQGERPLDWAAGEALALATLAVQGVRIRLSGQDAERGTFSHRHAVLHDIENGREYHPFQQLAPGQAPVEIYNSPLSEAAVMGFDYGYSLGWPDGLVMWEAQFGDFANAAQVIIDQFLVSAEDKWSRHSGLVLLLPHSFEGQGPEHSSARLERFLSLCADDNIQVVYPTTPAQIFHLLRRQALRPWRKPLVVMTPKSLLRLPEASSTLQELAQGGFQRIIPDTSVEANRADRVLLCTGKVYYELEQHRREHERRDVPILRLEQLHPINDEQLQAVLAPFPMDAPAIWVQEEPENMGAWRFLRCRYGETLFGRPLRCVTRPAAASPATGSKSSHKLEQKQLLERAFSPRVGDAAPPRRGFTAVKNSAPAS